MHLENVKLAEMVDPSRQASKKASEGKHADRSTGTAAIDDLEAALHLHRSTVASWLTAARPSNAGRIPDALPGNGEHGTERLGIGAKPSAASRRKGALSDGTMLAEERLRRALLPATVRSYGRLDGKGTQRGVKTKRPDDDGEESRARILGSR